MLSHNFCLHTPTPALTVMLQSTNISPVGTPTQNGSRVVKQTHRCLAAKDHTKPQEFDVVSAQQEEAEEEEDNKDKEEEELVEEEEEGAEAEAEAEEEKRQLLAN